MNTALWFWDDRAFRWASEDDAIAIAQSYDDRDSGMSRNRRPIEVAETHPDRPTTEPLQRRGSMGKVEVISPQIRTLSVAEATHLADRLMSRSLSTLFAASPEVRRDLCAASRVIRSLLHEYDRVASRLEDEAYRVRALRIDVGGV